MARRLIDQNPQREVSRQGILLDRLERQFARRIAAEIARASDDMADMFDITGEVMQPRDHAENMEAIFQAMAIATMTIFGARIVGQGKATAPLLETKGFAETMARIALQYVASEAIRRRITMIAETTRAQIITAVARGYEGGLGQRGIAAYIRAKVPALSQSRAGMIARTETHGAANHGANEAARESRLKLRREWISGEDDRTRLSHIEANGQIVGQDEPFIVGGVALMFPGDPAGPPGEVINCRCVVGFIVDDGF